MTNNIHQSAIIDPAAKIADNVKIGAYCVIGPNVEIGKNCELKSHVVIDGFTKIGKNNIIYPFASIGSAPQDLKFGGEESKVIIGDNNNIREYVTINPGTKTGAMQTVIGDNCLFMMSSHIAHDCIVGNNVILANNATLAGHVEVDDFVIIGGLSAIHQFVRIGKHAIIGGMSGVENDVIPFGSVIGERANLAGLNIVGMKRRQFSREEIHSLRGFYKALFLAQGGDLASRLNNIAKDFEKSEVVSQVIKFLKTDSSRAICQPAAKKVG